MTLPMPFVYPTSPHHRRHSPAGYEDYDSFNLLSAHHARNIFEFPWVP